ncbi:hypothetical protein [Crateriforma conspicua]|uniref:hypothetical protein n=1 Tax=Crateriforma conspicua TaxID=2527996 RepID=UPI00119E492D|nr:hypothetical protein [Crateriforma conspicua]
MMVNPYEPSHLEPEPTPVWTQLIRWILEPPPVRLTPERTSQWLVDSMVGFVVILTGFAVAGLISELLPFLRSMSYPTGLAIGCFPFVLWLNYCQSKDFTLRGYLRLLVFLFVFWTLQGGLNDLLLVPVAIAITLAALPFEIALGRLVLSALPGSSAQNLG